jgi:cell wall-associated NlpC family hydrolase
LLEYADLIGKPFVQSGEGPEGYDCWPLCQELARRQGRTLIDQEHIAGVPQQFQRLAGPEPGCLVLFWTTDRRKIDHVGMVLDDERFIHADPNTGVSVCYLSHPFWHGRIYGYYHYW